MSRIAVIQGHPDRKAAHLGDALVDAYVKGATAAKHEVTVIDVATLDFPLLRSAEDFEQGTVPPALAPVQQTLAASDHLVFIYPLWLGDMPALLKGFLEQVLRPAFVRDSGKFDKLFGHGPLSGKTARIVVTMGMPAAIYRLYYCAHSVRSFKRNILSLVGIRRVRDTIVGNLGSVSPRRARRLTATFERLGRKAR